ncbi:MAG TPA: hypothetical protein VGS19_15405 [Streptosporangiaceae bacterium]|nr:hypothetical protein [Streptosporangiaceae bacterium]
MRGRTITGGLAVTALAVAGWGAVAHASASSGGRAGTAVTYSRAGVSKMAPAMSCMPGEITAVSAVRPGSTRAGLRHLAPWPLAQFTDSVSGELAFFSPPRLPVVGAGSPLAHAPAAVMADRRLQSCEYLMQDRPAAQPYIAAAINAAVSRGLDRSVIHLRANVQMVLIGDNPLRPDSLVVTLLTTGRKVATDPLGHTIYGPYRAVIAMVNKASRHVTGVGTGTWPG